MTQSKYTSKQKRQIYEKINTLSSTEHEEIYNIIRRFNNISYSSNKNGVFFNISNLSDDVVQTIERFVDFCISNKKDLDEYDKKLNDCKASNNIINVNLGNITEIKPISINNTTAKYNAMPINNDILMMSVNDYVNEPKQTTRFLNFMEKLNADKTSKKKMNLKFHNAKKKYSKRIVQESKFEMDILGDLEVDNYLFTKPI